MSDLKRPLVKSLIIAVLPLISICGCGSFKTETDSVETSASSAESPVIADADEKNTQLNPKQMTNMTTETATFGGGCFWCTEAVFQRINGVEKVVSGYCNGDVENPTYKQVCTGTTGHAEVIQITFDPQKVAFAKLLQVHFKTHDPTTLNQQGADRGTQYRSGIYCHNEEQKKQAEEIIKSLDESGAFNDPIVTEVVDIAKFYPAEDYHQNYYNQNANDSYCAHVIVPKVEKFKKVFADILKDEDK